MYVPMYRCVALTTNNSLPFSLAFMNSENNSQWAKYNSVGGDQKRLATYLIAVQHTHTHTHTHYRMNEISVYFTLLRLLYTYVYVCMHTD